MAATADLLTAALAESGIEKKDTGDDPGNNLTEKAEVSNADQVDLFSQALFMLDEVTDEPSTEEPTEPIIHNEQYLSPSDTNLSQNQNSNTKTTQSSNNNANNPGTISHQLPAKLPENKTIFIRTPDGKFIKVEQPQVSQLANSKSGLATNGNASQPANTQANTSLSHSMSHKDVSRLWSNNDVIVEHVNPIDEEAEDEEEMGVAETYADYMPSKLKIGCRHPDPVVETSSLSSVEPPEVWYDMSIPESVIDEGELSALQLEAITYACQRHETILSSGERAGYLIGDGAGVGKGRTVAGIIYENWLVGRKRALWMSVSADLKIDAERDLNDIGATKIPVFPLNKFKYAKISSAENGYVKKGVIFTTYSSLIGESATKGKYKTRLKMLLNWCGVDFDGVIVLDECHKAKNLCPSSSSSKPTKTGMAVLELQQRLPKARIVYASATGATEPRNMAYMSRLGLWGPGTPFQEFKDFIHAVERRGVGAMELVAMDMKLRGMYIARQLSFKGVSFKIEDIPVPKENIKTYNAAVDLWVDARDKFTEAAALIDAERTMAKSMWGQFWSAHQRFFKYLCISSKTRYAIRTAKDAVKHGKCVVIGLQSTGEARTIEQLEEQGGELTDFISTAKGVFQSLIDKHFPAPDRKKALDLFGLDGKSSIFDDPDLKSIFNKTREKRKATMTLQGRSTRSGKNSVYKDDKLSDESSSESESDFKPSNDEQSDDNSDESTEEESENEDGSQDESEGDFNPFGGSDDDNDPWLKKMEKVQTKDSKLSSKSRPTKRKAKHKDKSGKKSKIEGSKPRRKRERDSPESVESSDLSGSEIDEIMDSVLGNQKRKQVVAKPPVESRSAPGSGSGTPVPTLSAAEAREKAQQMKKQLLDGIERVGERLPPNTLDELVDELGGTDCVAEMTGRKGRVVSDSAGAISYQLRSEQDVPLEILNLTEKQRFMDGEKYIAIISEAASSGISLQADRRVDNQRRRVHITLELPWSADRAIQQFGRTHRSNQVSAPEYMFLISELAGERRFASTVAKRLESLGALTHGDRRATESRDLSQFNIDNKYGRAALEICMKSIVGLERPLVLPPSHYKGDFMADVRDSLVGVGLVSKVGKHKTATLEKDYNQISKFLNRILGCHVEVQNALFQYFTDTLNAVILQAKKNGRFDQGILDLGSGGENVKVLNRQSFDSQYGGVSAKTELVTVSVERGLSWEQAMDIWGDHVGSDDGFYSSLSKMSRPVAILAVALSGSRKKERLYQIYRPNTGLSPKMELLSELKKRYKRVTPDEAEDTWLEQHEQSANMCSHEFWRGSCKRTITGTQCEIGLRTRTYNILTGSVLSVWNKVELAIAQSPGAQTSRMQVVRLRTNEGKRIVGTIIQANSRARLIQLLKQSNEPTQNSTQVHSQTALK